LRAGERKETAIDKDSNAPKPPRRAKREGTLADFLANSPLREFGIEIERFKEVAEPPDFEDADAPPLTVSKNLEK
jgi:hypothetical protein